MSAPSTDSTGRPDQSSRTLNPPLDDPRGDLNTSTPPRFAESNYPDRMVPIVDRPEHLLIGVAGGPLRTNAYVFAHNGMLGFPVADRLER